MYLSKKTLKATTGNRDNSKIERIDGGASLRGASLNRKASKSKNFNPVSKPPIFNISGKGKEKEKGNAQPEIISLLDDDRVFKGTVDENLLWVDKYEPMTESELAVHKRKIDEVRLWLQEAFDGGQSGNLRKYRRILVLTGPAGTAKTATIRVLAKEMGFEITEWVNSLEDYDEDQFDREALSRKFETFLARAASCNPLYSTTQASSSRHFTSVSATVAPSSSRVRRQIVLLEDLPNVLHQPTQALFHSALESFLAVPGIPLIIIISDMSIRGEVRDEGAAQGRSVYHSSREMVDIRTVIPQRLLNTSFVSQIAFNPIAPTLMLRAMQALVIKHYEGSNIPKNKRPTKEELNILVDASNGDIRSAIMSLQFSLAFGSPLGRQKAVPKNEMKQRLNGRTRVLMEVTSRREQALALFHLIGKVLYNKRKGDPLPQSISAKDRLLDQKLEDTLRDPLELPPWLSIEERRTSKVDPDSLYADSPIDTSLFSLYIHQNYPQFCNELEQCESLCDWLSWIDSSGGELWYQTNPHQFHLLTLGTLHSLPSPVPRHSQKISKPDFFDILKSTRDAEYSAEDIKMWLKNVSNVNWGTREIVQELAVVLKGWDKRSDYPALPAHNAFSTLPFRLLAPGTSYYGHHGNDHDDIISWNKDIVSRGVDIGSEEGRFGGSWLENDDIEED